MNRDIITKEEFQALHSLQGPPGISPSFSIQAEILQAIMDLQNTVYDLSERVNLLIATQEQGLINTVPVSEQSISTATIHAPSHTPEGTQIPSRLNRHYKKPIWKRILP